ncbi:MAG: site-specific integrase [Pseudonocardiaceae bacterium]
MADKVRRTLELHVYPTLGDLPLSALLPSAVQAWVTGLPLVPASAAVVLGYLSSALRAAVRDRLVASNPCDGVSAPSGRREQVWIPELATVDALRDALPARCRAVVDLVIGSWLRQGEVFGLEVERVDFLRTRTVDVTTQLVCLSRTRPTWMRSSPRHRSG